MTQLRQATRCARRKSDSEQSHARRHPAQGDDDRASPRKGRPEDRGPARGVCGFHGTARHVPVLVQHRDAVIRASAAFGEPLDPTAFQKHLFFEQRAAPRRFLKLLGIRTVAPASRRNEKHGTAKRTDTRTDTDCRAVRGDSGMMRPCPRNPNRPARGSRAQAFPRLRSYP